MRLIIEPGSALHGSVLYTIAEHSFRFDIADPQALGDREGGRGRSSVVVGTLQVEVGAEDGTALFVWGLHPRARWIEATLPSPNPQPGVIKFQEEFAAGVSIRVAQVGDWSTTYDAVSGWVRVAPDMEDGLLVTIADGTLLGVRDNRLHAIWLRPVIA